MPRLKNIFARYMKRLLALPLLLLYFITSTGMMVQLHYCSDRLSSVAINGTASCCCDDADSTQNTSDCCSDQVIKASTPSDQIISAFVWSLEQISTTVPPSFFNFYSSGSIPGLATGVLRKRPHGPPGKAFSLALYKAHQSWLLYA